MPSRVIGWHDGPIRCLAVSPCGRFLVSGSDDCTLKVWATDSLRCLQALRHARTYVSCVLFLPDGRLVSGGCALEYKLLVWNLGTGQIEMSLNFDDENYYVGISGMALLPDDRLVTHSNDQNVCVWNLDSGKCERIFQAHDLHVTSIEVLPDGRLVTASESSLKLWNTESWECEKNIETGVDQVSGLALLPDGRLVLTCKYQNILKIYNPSSDILERTIVDTDLEDADDSAIGQVIKVLPDGRVATSGRSCSIKVWNLKTGVSEVTLEGHDSTVNALAYLPDGTLVSAGSTDRSLNVWDLKGGQLLRSIRGHAYRIFAVAMLPDGRVVTSSMDSFIKVWNKSGECVKTFSHGPSWDVFCLIILPDGRLASGSVDCLVKIWDVSTGRCDITLVGHQKFVLDLELLTDGTLVSSSRDTTIRAWDICSGKCTRILEGHTNNVSVVRALPENKLASASSDCTVKVWELESETGSCIATLKGHTATVTFLVLLPDGRLLSGSSDFHIRVWKWETGECLQVLSEHQSEIAGLCVSDGRLISLDSYHNLKVWSLPDLQVIRTHTNAFKPVPIKHRYCQSAIISSSSVCIHTSWAAYRDFFLGRCKSVSKASQPHVLRDLPFSLCRIIFEFL
eukprot:GILI01025405.1.p1 GENE.GILI01025405.1~~GILI01025405.1.p1  ORF type:complete len:624 (+),score=47.68 GILI01025405.1:121-1992(+)